MGPTEKRRLWPFLEKNKPALLVLLLGVLLMLLPSGLFSGGGTGAAAAEFDTDEEKLAAVLSCVEGAGQVSVLLRTGEEGGAVIVCQGADSAAVRLRVVRAASAYTGLGSDRIVVLKMES